MTGPAFLLRITTVIKSRFRSHLELCEEVHLSAKPVEGLVESGIHPLFLCETKIGGLTIANPKNRKNSVRMNEDIRFPEIRVIDADGEMRGVMSLDDGISLAEESGLDLVLISPNPDNPVARVMDYGKYTYEQSKREREARRNQKTTDVKEVQIKLTTEEHDTNVKVRNAIRFLKGEDRVKVVIRFRGREMSYKNQGYAVMKAFADACESAGKIDRPPRIEGRNMVMFLAPYSPKELRDYERRQALKEEEEEE